MDVTFTGIQNIKIYQKSYNKFGSYLSYDNEIKQGNKLYNEIKIHCDLTKDNKSDDIGNFYSALERAGKDYAQHCINPQKPNHIELFAKGFTVKDDITTASNATFTINGKEIKLTNDKVLALYTFMAQLTRKIVHKPEISERQKHFTQIVNNFVDNNARDYLDLPLVIK